MVVHSRFRQATVFAVAALAVACAPAAPPRDPSVQQAAPSPQRGGVFQYAQRQASTHLNFFTGSSVSQRQTLAPVYEPLVNFDYRDGDDFRLKDSPVPWLAESWRVEDPRTWIFKIRSGVRWHDDKPFTAADVAYTYRYVADPKLASTFAANVRGIEAAETPDAQTVRITTKQPLASLLFDLADTVILPKHLLDEGKTFEKSAVGTGPFRVESFKAEQEARLRRFDGYWQGGKPYLDAVTILMRIDDAGQQAAFATRQVDIVTMQDKAQFEAYAKTVPSLKSEPYLADITDSLHMKLDRPPFGDIRVRQAVHLAIDRQGLVNTLTYGLGGIEPPAVNGAKRGWALPQEELLKLPGYRQPKAADLAEARRLLAEAGYTDGFDSSVMFVSTYVGTPQGAEALSEQLRKVGVRLALKPTEAGVFEKAIREGAFDTYYTGFARFLPEPTWRNVLHSKGGLNSFPIQDAELDALVEAQDRELDIPKRKELFRQIQRRLLDRLYVIPTFSAGIVAVWQPYLHGYVFNRARQTYPRTYDILWVDEQAPKDR